MEAASAVNSFVRSSQFLPLGPAPNSAWDRAIFFARRARAGDGGLHRANGAG